MRIQVMVLGSLDYILWSINQRSERATTLFVSDHHPPPTHTTRLKHSNILNDWRRDRSRWMDDMMGHVIQVQAVVK